MYHGAVETNNGTEALNKLLKYKYLPKQKHMTLSHVITNITTQFLPAQHYKYVFKNFKQSDLYRSYNSSLVPSYLQGRPRQTILHCLHRLASSNKFSKSDVHHINDSGNFEVRGSKGMKTVSFGDKCNEPACTCKDWIKFHIPCKHFFAVFQNFHEWGWDRLPSNYLNSPYLTSDNQAIKQYFHSKTKKDSPPDSSDALDDLAASSLDDPEEANITCDQIPTKVQYKYFS